MTPEIDRMPPTGDESDAAIELFVQDLSGWVVSRVESF